MKLVVALVVALALLALMEPAAAGLKFTDQDLKSEEAVWRLYRRWLAHFNVSRHPAEKARRFELFKETARRIHRRAAVRGRHAPGLNGFADLSSTEFDRDYGCSDTPAADEARLPVTRRGDEGLPLPISVDWRNKTCGTGPCLPPVKNQRGCGSCWAFAAVGAVESHVAIQRARARDNRPALLDLSEQELVDCDNYGHGCKSGNPINALNYIVEHGISSEANYPYTATNGTCQASSKLPVDTNVSGFEVVPPYDEFELLSAVVDGPVVVTISVGKDNWEFRNYVEDYGVYDGRCTRESFHSLLLVGYNYEAYILKNSWGDEWGYKGYMYLKRDTGNRNGTCDILRAGGSYPTFG